MHKPNAHIKALACLGISFLIPFFAFTQNHNVPLNQSSNVDFEREVLKSEAIIHQSFKPVLEQELDKLDGNKELISPSLASPKKADRSFVSRKLFFEHYISLDTGIVHLTIDPIINFELGEDQEEDPRNISLFKNTRGFNLKLDVGSKVSFESSFRENQANLPLYLSQRTNISDVAYGQGRVKQFKTDGYDFAMASAYVSYSPSGRINIQAGHGKHFVGNGHRSLLLSDLAFNYPFLKINTNWVDGKIQYQNLYTVFQDLDRLESTDGTEGLFARKQGAFNFLEFSPSNKISFSLFEGVLFPSLDTSGNIGVGANFWAPVIGLNTLIEGPEQKGNSILGTNLTIRIGKKLHLYNQFAIADERVANLAFQLGGKWFLHKNIMLQGEYNSTGSLHKNNLYSHYQESLNHPLNVEASELVGIAQFRKNRWVTRGMLNYILSDDYDVQYLDFRQSFVINPSFNFTVHLGAQIRNFEQSQDIIQNNPLVVLPYANQNSSFFYFGLSTNLQNIYFNY